MPRVYVFDSLMPMGGAYMAYHIGRLLHVHFGYEYVDVEPRPYQGKVFDYDIAMKSMNLDGMQRSITKEDVLIANPSYSRMLFGLCLPGRKIMYVQDYKTFKLLDCHFDLYVSVSALVQRYVQAVYHMPTPVIPPFIELGKLPKVKPWHERPEGSALVYQKHADSEQDVAFDFLKHVLGRQAPQIDLSSVLKGRNLEHREFLNEIGSVRYLVNMSLSEGFGLVPLEAMAMGTMVTGVDSLGSVDYMRQERNCLVAPVTNLRLLPGIVMHAFANTQLAASCAAAGIQTAQAYSYAAFKKAWLAQLSGFLKMEPSDG